MEVGGKTLRFETGELAKQAGGAVLMTYGETVVLVTATANAKPKTGVSFFPLTVDYEEKMYAAGKIPGGWIKREGRAPERCTLTSRLIDRPIRPLFPDGFRNDTHVVGLTMSVDGENEPDVIAICGAGAALALSDIPFDGPVAGVRVGYVEGEFVINPTQEQIEKSSLNLVVAGTKDSICMVEAGAYEVSEQLVLEAIEEAHDTIKKIVAVVEKLVKKAGKAKKEYPLFIPDKTLDTAFRKHMGKAVAKGMRIIDKKERNDAFGEITKEALADKLGKDKNKEELLAILADGTRDDFDTIMKKVQEEELMTMIVEEGIRPDGRKTTEIRKLSARVGILPRTHGTGLFTRGQTQILTIATLGTLAEEQSFDNVIGEVSRRYIHQYNFPPFSVGEARFMRGPGRREIGHGALAERALVPVIPDENEFPYTLRMVSEALESNGSTSMASVCGSTLALMDAGVPIKAPVGGIAMGLVAKGDKFAVLTDIQGLEDALGEMDFKVAGTREGITALQMDIKLKGVSGEVLRQALAQAKDARLTIIDVIESALPAPRAEISPRAPHITSFIINPEKIKDVIGPGGKTINRIIAETGVKIDIESDGRVFVASINREMVERAKKIVEDLTRDIEVGSVFTGAVMRLMNFGAFVEVVPGKEGLLHVSQLKPYHVGRVEDVVKVGDMINFRVEEIDSMGRLNLSRKGLFTEEELAEAEAKGGARPPREGGDRGDRGGDRGDRGGDRGDRGGDRGDRGGDRGDRGGDRGDRGGDRGDRGGDRGDRGPRGGGDRGPRGGGGGERNGRDRGGDRGDRGAAESRPPRDFTQERPSRDRDDRPAPRDRDDRPFSRDRDERPAPRDRDDRPAPRDRDDRPSSRDRDDRPSSRDRDDRPASRDRDDRPAPRSRDDRPAPRGRDERPASRDRDDRPAPRGRDDRPVSRDRDDRPAPRDR
ncbi:polyribonucleotide nucleotidyltransferase, partial [bacterium SCN 62-11]